MHGTSLITRIRPPELMQRPFVAGEDIPSGSGEKIKPFALKINPLELIEEIIISPYIKEPFASSVVAICKKYNIPENKVRKSNLLVDYKKMIFYPN